MWLDGTALVLKSPASVQFLNNHAEEFGGAIYVLDSDEMLERQCKANLLAESCFFRVETVNTSRLAIDVHLNFSHNSAFNAGTVLYGGALDLCKVNGNMKGYQFFPNISTFIPSINKAQHSSISSEPLKACFCEDGVVDCSTRHKMVSTVPGRTLYMFIANVGQLDMPVHSNIKASFRINGNTTEFQSQNVYCAKIPFKLNSYEIINIYPKRCAGSPLHVEVTVNPCPNGFNLDYDQCKCEANLSCDIQTGLIRSPANYWIAPYFSESLNYLGFMWHSNCPNDYCKKGPSILSFSTQLNSDIQCTENRTDIICGACRVGYSLTLSSLQCKECENKFISLILLFGIAGVALIVILFASHMTVAAGTINGLILYANIVNIHRSTFFPPDKTSVNPLSVFIAWLNLDLGIPTCFYDGLDSYVYSWLQYVFPFYLWLLIGAIILSSKYSIRARRLFGSNPVAVLATVILMSFTKLLQTTVRTLNYTYLEYSSGTCSAVWVSDGNLAYFGGKHAILAIAEILMITIFLLPYIFLLTFGYCLQACSGKKGFLWFNKFTPLLDAYYAPYTKNTRYWTGLMLLVRVCLFASFMANTNSRNLVYVLSFFMAITVLAWLNGGIYSKLYVNIIEASFVLNVGILSIATLHIQVAGGNQAVASYLSVGIALTEFVGIIVFHLFLSIKNAKFFHEWKYVERVRERLVELETKKASSIEAEPAKSATSTLVEIREPLLESVSIAQ